MTLYQVGTEPLRKFGAETRLAYKHCLLRRVRTG